MNNNIEENKKLIEIIESGLHEFGINFMTNYKSYWNISWEAQYFINTNKDQQKYDEINNWLLHYFHKPFVICPWTAKEIYDPEQQLLNRFQNYNKYWCDNTDI
jgi:hypothetical protein